MFSRNRLVLKSSRFRSVFECSNKLSTLSVLKNINNINNLDKNNAYKRKLLNSSLIHYRNYSNSLIVKKENFFTGPLLENNAIDINFVKEMIKHFHNNKLIPKESVIEILKASIEYHKLLPTLLRLNIPNNGNFNICGDTHGQFRDFCEILSDDVGSFPSSSNPFLFNGDFVDRGSQSFEV
jgi:serine/threonine-protein phosphatase 5